MKSGWGPSRSPSGRMTPKTVSVTTPRSAGSTGTKTSGSRPILSAGMISSSWRKWRIKHTPGSTSRAGRSLRRKAAVKPRSEGVSPLLAHRGFLLRFTASRIVPRNNPHQRLHAFGVLCGRMSLAPPRLLDKAHEQGIAIALRLFPNRTRNGQVEEPVGICSQHIESEQRCFTRKLPARVEVDDGHEQKFLFGRGDGLRNQVSFRIQNAAQIGPPMNFAPEVSVMFGECQ